MANPIGYTTAAEVERLREGKTAVVQGEATAEGVPVFLEERARTAYDAIGSGVKALEWRDVTVNHGPEAYEAESPVGHFQVFTDEDSASGAILAEWAWDQRNFGRTEAKSIGRYPDFDEAKAAAQAGFERRVLSCLSPVAEEEADAKAGDREETIERNPTSAAAWRREAERLALKCDDLETAIAVGRSQIQSRENALVRARDEALSERGGRWFPHNEAPSGSYACLYRKGEEAVRLAWMPAQGRPDMPDTIVMPFAMPGESAAAPSTPSPQIGKAGAGPVGEAVAIHAYAQEYEFRFDDGGGYTPTDAERAMLEDAITGFLSTYTSPVVEPGEVERLTRERDEALAGWETANAKRIASERDRIAAEAALAETREEAAQLTSERDNAVAAAKMLTGSHAKIRDELAETREGLEKLLAAVGKARTSLAGFTSADDAAFALDVAIGEVADWKRRALTGDAQEGGK